MELTMDQIKLIIEQGRKLSLTKDFYHNSIILIGKEKILSIQDIERLSSLGKLKLEVKEAEESIIPIQIKKTILEQILSLFSDHQYYQKMNGSKKKEISKIINNIFIPSDYLSYALHHIHHFSKKIYTHSIHVALISLTVDLAWQKRHNQGLIDGMKLEHIFYGALLHDLGYLTLPKDLSETKRKNKDFKNTKLKEHPTLGYELLMRDKMKHKYSNDILNIVLQHEERNNSTGFPMGLNGNQIDLNAQIVGLCNEFEHLLNNEITDQQKTFYDLTGYLIARKQFFNPECITVLIEEFRHLS